MYYVLSRSLLVSLRLAKQVVCKYQSSPSLELHYYLLYATIHYIWTQIYLAVVALSSGDSNAAYGFHLNIL